MQCVVFSSGSRRDCGGPTVRNRKERVTTGIIRGENKSDGVSVSCDHCCCWMLVRLAGVAFCLALVSNTLAYTETSAYVECSSLQRQRGTVAPNCRNGSTSGISPEMDARYSDSTV